MKRNEMHPKSSSGPLVSLATLPLTAFACCGSRPSSTSSGTKLLCSPKPSLSESRGIESEKSLKALRVTALASSAQSGPKSNLKRPFLCHRASGELQGRSDRESGALKIEENTLNACLKTVSRRQMHATPSSTLTHTSVRSSGRRHSKCGMPQPRTPEVIDSVPCTAAVPGIRVRHC